MSFKFTLSLYFDGSVGRFDDATLYNKDGDTLYYLIRDQRQMDATKRTLGIYTGSVCDLYVDTVNQGKYLLVDVFEDITPSFCKIQLKRCK